MKASTYAVGFTACTGKAGGFLALDWQDGGATGPLGRLSFKLHQELADSLGKDIGYRRVQTLSAAAAPAKTGHPQANHLYCDSIRINQDIRAQLAAHDEHLLHTHKVCR